MPILHADLVQDTTSSTGTGALTLAGSPPTGFQAFTNGQWYYSIRHASLNEWEIGLATVSSSTTFTRTQVLASSNSGSAVNFSSGTKYVRNVMPADVARRVRSRLTTDFTSFGTLLSGLGPNELTTEGELTTWTAFSGASPTQATAANRPRVSLAGCNGWPCVIFTPSKASYLSWSSGALNLTNHRFTVIAVLRRNRQRTSEAYGDPVVFGAASGGFICGLQNNLTEVLHIAKAATSSAGNLAPIAFDSWRICTWRLNGTNGYGSVDGNTEVSQTYAPTFTGSIVHHLGFDNSSIYFGGAIALLLVYDGDIGATNLANAITAIKDEMGVG